jgi:hypothetical protein
MKNIKFSNWQKLFIVTILLQIILSTGTVQSQVIDVKKWKGTYPEMEGSYPLSFISFTGWLIPIPHLFIRTWPTHYYVEVGALPVMDAPEIAGQIKTGLIRIAAKMLERHQMKGRHDETQQIKVNRDFQKMIEERFFDSRTDQLEDIYQLAQRFIHLYKKVDKLGQLHKASEVKRIFEKESDQLLLRFLMVNLMKNDHGEKLEAFSEINTTLNKLLGEVDYTFSKIHFFNSYNEETANYSFLIH